MDQRLADEEPRKLLPIETGSAVTLDLHYESGSYVCDAGYEYIWEAIPNKL